MTGCLNRSDDGACAFSVHSRDSGNPALTHIWVRAFARTTGDVDAVRDAHSFFPKLTPFGGSMESGTKKSTCSGWLGSTRY